MTKKEALIAILQVSVPEITVEKAMIDQGITGSESYSLSSEKDIDLCAVKILQWLQSVPNISEGGMSITHNLEGIKSVLLSLAKKHSLTEILSEFKPSVTGKSLW
jgi:hypothetical protein